MTLKKDYPIANPMVVFREEFDDWAVLFNPDSNETFGLNPVSAFIWKKLDGKHDKNAILETLKTQCDDVPEDAENHIQEFISELDKKGLVAFEKI